MGGKTAVASGFFFMVKEKRKQLPGTDTIRTRILTLKFKTLINIKLQTERLPYENSLYIISSPEPKAHGELIVYQSSGRLSVCASVCLSVNIFKLEYQWANRN